jgi:hypothetical protein
VGSIQAVRADAPGGIALSVAPAPPPNEYPEIRAAVVAAQKEVKAGAKLKFGDLYRLGQVIGTGHYARCVRVRVRACVRVGGGPGGGGVFDCCSSTRREVRQQQLALRHAWAPP